MRKRFGAMAMGLFDWLKGKGSQQSVLEPLTDEQYQALFIRLLQGVADGWDGDRLRQVLGDRFADPQMLVWLQGYGEGLLTGTNGDWARLLVRLGEVGCGEIGVMAREFGLRVLEAIPTVSEVAEAIPPAPLDKGDVLVDGLQDQDANSFSQVQETFFSGKNDQSDEAEKCLEKGLDLCIEGREEEGIVAFENALKIKPDYHEAWHDRGVALANLGRNEEAIASYDHALKIKPDYHKAWHNRGNALADLGRLEEAIASYDHALKIKPDYHKAWHNRGTALADLGRLEEAIASYDQALKIKPDYHKAWYNRGNTLVDLGRLEEAITSYDNALKIKPDYHKAWYNRGFALFNLGRLEEAITSYDNALKIKPDDHEAWYNRGFALGNLDKYEEAITSHDNALKIKPDKDEAWNNRGIALRNLGKYEEAITSYDNALTLTRGKDWQAWVNRSIAVSQLVRKRTFLIHSLPPAMQHPDIEEPDYRGQLACLREGLKYVERATEPEGWGQLHRFTGLAHHDYARRQENPYPFWRKAVPCYETALEALTEDQFPTAHLETLQDLIRVLNALKDTETAQTLLREGTDLLERLLSQKTGVAKDLFERQFRPAFNELTVALAVQSGDWPTALEIAEQDKNALLRQGLLSNQPAQSPNYGQMQTFLQQQPHTAILYWHLSANALTTFLLTGDQVEAISSDFSQLIQLETWIKAWKEDYPTDKKETSTPPLSRGAGGINPQNGTDESNPVINNSSQTSTPPLSRGAGGINPQNETDEINPQNQTGKNLPKISFSYQTVQKSGEISSNLPKNESKNAEIPPKLPQNPSKSAEIPPNPPLKGGNLIQPRNEKGGNMVQAQNSTDGRVWRDRLGQRLETLKILLFIPEIETKLAQFAQINRLILIPHRDLYLFPLDSLFTNQYTISYLPSIQVGINLLAHPTNPENRLLSIENPDSIQTNDDGTVTKFPPLTAAEAESELICGLYPQTTRLHKNQAILPQVTAQLNQPHNVLHFTGHGYYNFKQPLQSALALSQADRLTLNEIIKLDLTTYDLACLCACETAIAGNQTITTEYIGIVSAFLYGGVAKVVSTLWTVESVASAVLMVEFHHRRLTGKPESQALSEAKHWLRTASVAELSRWYQQQMDALPDDHSLRPWLCDRLDELATMKPDSIPYENPYFWAAFTLTGL